ncbi:MAG: cytochrome C [Desulfuromonas sp.]|nr:MAG: cytochrome C [Desulfuromonas sp.]
MRLLIKLVIVCVVIFVAIQFVPYGEHTNPPVVSEPAWDSPQTRELFVRACANCHSNETIWPWYSTYAPASWMVAFDVEEGRKHFNVSMWGEQEMNFGEAAADMLQVGAMPPWYYLPAHPEAKLSFEEKNALVNGLRKTFSGEGN